MPDAPPLPDPPPLNPTAAIFCPECGYNLSGTTADRCSECGQSFDRAALTAWTSELGQPLPYGPLHTGQPRPSLIQASLFSPRDLGRLLPPFANWEEAVGHGQRMRLWAGLWVPLITLLILALYAGNLAPLFLVIVILPPVFGASSFCEVVIAALLTRWVPPRAVPRAFEHDFWRTLLRCFSTHLLISSIVCCTLYDLPWLMGQIFTPLVGVPSPNPLQSPLLQSAMLATVTWWWYCVGRAIAARGTACAARTLIILLVPVIAAGAIVVGILIGAFTGLLATVLCSGLIR